MPIIINSGENKMMVATILLNCWVGEFLFVQIKQDDCVEWDEAEAINRWSLLDGGIV